VGGPFRGWTTDRLLQASFRGVREDKPAREVKRHALGNKAASKDPESAAGEIWSEYEFA